MSKSFIILAIMALSLGFCSIANADSQGLSGYIYSDGAGWISLNCSNTNSCNSIGYGVSEGGNGQLSGYGYSQHSGWVNFNPNYGGVIINSNGSLSGWAYSATGGWLEINSSKIISVNDLQNEITSVANTVNSNNLSSTGTASLLNSLCSQFLSDSDCNIVNNQ